jgi:hypothetical protein
MQTGIGKRAGHQGHGWRFAGASYGDIADGNDTAGKLQAFEKPAGIQAKARGDTQAKQQRAQPQRQQQRIDKRTRLLHVQHGF